MSIQNLIPGGPIQHVLELGTLYFGHFVGAVKLVERFVNIAFELFELVGQYG